MVLRPVVSVRCLSGECLAACAISRMTQSVIEWVTTRSVGTISLLVIGVSQFRQG
jgi:hypothetical protein